MCPFLYYLIETYCWPKNQHYKNPKKETWFFDDFPFFRVIFQVPAVDFEGGSFSPFGHRHSQEVRLRDVASTWPGWKFVLGIIGWHPLPRLEMKGKGKINNLFFLRQHRDFLKENKTIQHGSGWWFPFHFWVMILFSNDPGECSLVNLYIWLRSKLLKVDSSFFRTPRGVPKVCRTAFYAAAPEKIRSPFKGFAGIIFKKNIYI